jgi:urease accessory protein
MIFGRSADTRTADAWLVLPFEMRCRSRFRACLENGEPVGVVIPRGTVLRGGDLLLAEDGRVIEVRAALESVSTAMTDDPRLLARAAYHLGNRHVPVELGAGWLRYGHDHVLDDMVLGLGLRLTVADLPFEPEAGAYRSHAGMHGHGHSHRH